MIQLHRCPVPQRRIPSHTVAIMSDNGTYASSIHDPSLLLPVPTGRMATGGVLHVMCMLMSSSMDSTQPTVPSPPAASTLNLAKRRNASRLRFHGQARQGKARQGKARQGKARQGKARQGKARQGKARQGKAASACAATYPGIGPATLKSTTWCRFSIRPILQ